MRTKFFFTDRHGGVSAPPYNSLNLALHVGDNKDDVEKNRKILQRRLNFKNIIWMEQIHKSNIQIISSPQPQPIPDCDAIITDQPNIALAVMVAGCIPILMFDPKRNVIAAIHAGRNGTFLQIGAKTVKIMQKEFGCLPADILVFMGPSIQVCCYEIGDKLISIVKKNFGKKYINDKMLNLQKLNYDQLIKSKIRADNIKISNTCTCCDNNYFSYRRDGITGRFVGVIWME